MRRKSAANRRRSTRWQLRTCVFCSDLSTTLRLVHGVHFQLVHFTFHSRQPSAGFTAMSDYSPFMSATLPRDEQRPSGRDLDALEKARPTAPSPQKRPLRIAIVTENFLPKIDGVTRTLAMLLEHLQAEGHEAMVLGPATPLVRSRLAHPLIPPSGTERVLEQKTYAGAEVVATKGIPLLGVYRGLGLNFLRPRFIRKLRKCSCMA